MAGGRRLTQEQIDHIIDLRAKGLSWKGIRKQTGHSTATIWRHAKGVSKGEPPDEEENGHGSVDPSETPDNLNGDDDRGRPKEPKAPKSTRVVHDLDQAAILSVVPQKFETSSTLFWMAKMITERHWGWKKLSPGDWLDTYLYFSLKAFGITLGGYTIDTNGREGDHGS